VPNLSIESGNVMFLIFVLFCGLYLYNALITFYNRENGIVLWKTKAWVFIMGLSLTANQRQAGVG
jgi:hypothetical protein